MKEGDVSDVIEKPRQMVDFVDSRPPTDNAIVATVVGHIRDNQEIHRRQPVAAA
jgi:hypothetical protein